MRLIPGAAKEREIRGRITSELEEGQREMLQFKHGVIRFLRAEISASEKTSFAP